jgi:hypothetical protein
MPGALEVSDFGWSGKLPDRLEVETVDESTLTNRFAEVDSPTVQAFVATEGKAIRVRAGCENHHRFSKAQLEMPFDFVMTPRSDFYHSWFDLLVSEQIDRTWWSC